MMTRDVVNALLLTHYWPNSPHLIVVVPPQLWNLMRDIPNTQSVYRLCGPSYCSRGYIAILLHPH